MTTEQNSPYNLFGVDLSQYAAKAVLGWQQLLWGEDVGLKSRFCPPVRLLNADVSAVSGLAAQQPVASANDKECLGWLLPDAEVLIREFTLPITAEIFLREAVVSTVHAHSPFEFAETCYGYCIAGRDKTQLTVRVAMVLRNTASDQLSAARVHLQSDGEPIELWVDDGDVAILIEGFGEHSRVSRYHRNLREFGLRSLASLVGILLILTLPALWVNQHARQLQDLRAQTQARVGTVVATRGELVRSQEMIAAAESLLEPYVDYGPWLHAVASVTPDQVYFNRIGIDGRTLTVSGLAENAADFQSVLAESDWFDDLVAPSAFTRDERARRERFTLSMKLVGEPSG